MDLVVFPLLGTLTFPSCIPTKTRCCTVQLLNEVFPWKDSFSFQRRNCSVIVPYLHGIHASPDPPPWQTVASTRRPVLLVFVGARQRGAGARAGYLQKLEAAGAAARSSHNRRLHQQQPFQAVLIEEKSTMRWASLSEEHLYVRIWKAYASAVFCLQPPGDTVTRRGFYDSWLLGCIPVVVTSSALQYASLYNGMLFRDAGDFNRSALVVEEPDLTSEVGSAALLQRLASMPPEEVAARQQRLRELASAMQWSLSRAGPTSTSLDAFELAIAAARMLAGERGVYSSRLASVSATAIRLPHKGKVA